MKPGLDKGIRLALRAARTFQTELANAAALARDKERDDLIRVAQHIHAKIEEMKGIIRYSYSEAKDGR